LALAGAAALALAGAETEATFLGAVKEDTMRIFDFFAVAAVTGAAASSLAATFSLFRLKINHRFRYENCWTASFIL
jgi:hypothetical protein